jgi:hypothetical protein
MGTLVTCYVTTPRQVCVIIRVSARVQSQDFTTSTSPSALPFSDVKESRSIGFLLRLRGEIVAGEIFNDSRCILNDAAREFSKSSPRQNDFNGNPNRFVGRRNGDASVRREIGVSANETFRQDRAVARQNNGLSRSPKLSRVLWSDFRGSPSEFRRVPNETFGLPNASRDTWNAKIRSPDGARRVSDVSSDTTSASHDLPSGFCESLLRLASDILAVVRFRTTLENVWFAVKSSAAAGPSHRLLRAQCAATSGTCRTPFVDRRPEATTR